nr:DUF3048 domain-containing protein [Rhabdothermincola salaria]
MRIGAIAAAVLAVIGAVVVFVFVLGSDDEQVAPTTTTTTTIPTTTTEPPPPVRSPLTGLPTDDPVGELHPAVTVKMDNSPDARPQSGINDADIVYEMKVEGITRFGVVFHSRIVDGVGPVRSARSSDIDLVADLSRPLFVWSGGNAGVTGEVLQAAREDVLTNASFDAAEGFYYRSSERRSPHNLYVNLVPLVAERSPEGQWGPAPLFEYRVAETEPHPVPAEAVPVAGVSVDFGLRQVVDYVWDAEREGWNRYQVDTRHARENSAAVDQDGRQVAPANVVIQWVEYGVSAADSRSPRAITVGEGDALVLTAGQAIPGRWSRPTRDQPARFTDAAGQPILLTPGATWVALPEAGTPAPYLDQPTADALLAVRR